MGIYTKVAGIYCIANIQNNKKYVGYSKNIKKRWDNHKYNLRKNSSKNTHLQAAWNIYGENMFTFSILEIMSYLLNKQDYEKVETKWVLHFQTHKHEFGYNAVLPGFIPLREEGENKTSLVRSNPSYEYICINTLTKEVVEAANVRDVIALTGIPANHVAEISKYWVNLGDGVSHTWRKKSAKGWMAIKKKDYNPEFDYTGFKKERKTKDGVKKTWRDYPRSIYIKKNPEDIIPREDRNLKRRGVVAVDVITGEERVFRMLKDTYTEFMQMKVYKCINAPFGKYKHRGHYFRYSE